VISPCPAVVTPPRRPIVVPFLRTYKATSRHDDNFSGLARDGDIPFDDLGANRFEEENAV